MSDPFALLGLSRRPWLDEAAIRTAFQDRVRRSHPDAAGGNAEDFTTLNSAQATVTNPATRLRLLIGEGTPLPAMPADFQLGFRIGEVVRKAEALRDQKSAACNVLAQALLMKEAASLREELQEVAVALAASKLALDARLRTIDERWPNVPAHELAVLAGEYVFFTRWQHQIREGLLTLRISFSSA